MYTHVLPEQCHARSILLIAKMMNSVRHFHALERGRYTLNFILPFQLAYGILYKTVNKSLLSPI